MKRRILKADARWNQVPFNFDTDLDMFYQLRQDGWVIFQDPSGILMITPLLLQDTPFKKTYGFRYDFVDKVFSFYEAWAVRVVAPGRDDFESAAVNTRFLLDALPKAYDIPPSEFLATSKNILIIFKKMAKHFKYRGLT